MAHLRTPFISLYGGHLGSILQPPFALGPYLESKSSRSWENSGCNHLALTSGEFTEVRVQLSKPNSLLRETAVRVQIPWHTRESLYNITSSTTPSQTAINKDKAKLKKNKKKKKANQKTTHTHTHTPCQTNPKPYQPNTKPKPYQSRMPKRTKPNKINRNKANIQHPSEAVAAGWCPLAHPDRWSAGSRARKETKTARAPPHLARLIPKYASHGINQLASWGREASRGIPCLEKQPVGRSQETNPARCQGKP